jgi:glycosyltransferase involved in cell wall biosynthesis
VAWIGGGSTTQGGVQALERAGIPMTGWIPRDDAIARLSDSRAYLHWTAWDGQPLSVLEAMARDVVVIASDIPPNREILGENQVFGSVETAIDHLRRVLTDDAYAHELLAEQRRRRTTYSAARMAADWSDVYDELVCGG